MEKEIFRPGRFTIMDGGMGTMLQQVGMPAGMRPEGMIFSQPDKLMEIHRAYAQAGSDVLCANTFGANAKKLAGSGHTVQEVVSGAVRLAKQACEGTAAQVILDVGPLGELLEPSGTLSFEEAYTLFREVVCAGEQAGADLVKFATFTDLHELKAGILAAVENTRLPVLASMTFEKDGRTFTGVPVRAMASTLEALGVVGLGINCSLGPAELVPLAKELCAATRLPVYIKPNAGLPDPVSGHFHLSPEDFVRQMQPLMQVGGVQMVGGCCGTTPDTIRLLKQSFGTVVPAVRQYVGRSLVCSATRVVDIDGVVPIGERINPTGKKRLQAALQNGDMAYVQTQAVLQSRDGAKILDVNVGAPGVDEVALLPKAVKAVQAVCDLPLQLDSTNPAALEAALRVYNGKAIVNSTTGEAEKLAAILPLCKKYGAAVVGLTLDEDGIPAEAAQRLAVAQKILNAALEAGIPREDVYIDCLTLTVSASPDAALATLEATRLVKERLGLKTLLGVSNVSFGLPNRPLANTTFLTMALAAGLDLPIMNPALTPMMDAIAAYTLLAGRDKDAAAYIARFGGEQGTAAPKAPAPAGEIPLGEAIVQGLSAQAADAAKILLVGGVERLTIVDDFLVPALDKVGAAYEAGTMFLPQLLAAAGAAQATFEVIRQSYAGGEDTAGPPVVVATVQGDVHDIGKNIARVLLENYGFTVTDLGRDVPPADVVAAAKKTGAKLVGLSALMTTTLPSLERTLQDLRREAPGCKVLVGGAVLTQEYADGIGADYYAKDALATVHAAQEVYT